MLVKDVTDRMYQAKCLIIVEYENGKFHDYEVDWLISETKRINIEGYSNYKYFCELPVKVQNSNVTLIGYNAPADCIEIDCAWRDNGGYNND